MQIGKKVAFILIGWIVSTYILWGRPSVDAAELQITLMKAKPAIAHIFVKVLGQVATNEGQRLWPLNAEMGSVKGGSGSGFFINPNGYLVTNGHVVADAHETNEDYMKLLTFQKYLEQVEIPKYERENNVILSQAQREELLRNFHKKLKENLKISLKKEIHVVLSNGKVYPAEVKEYSPAVTPVYGGSGTVSTQVLGVDVTMRTGKDVSILKIEDRNFPTVALGDSASVQIGEKIHVIGYPAAADSAILSEASRLLEQSITTGHISGGKVDIKGTPMIQTDANITWGNSGGPCINSEGKVVGIVSYIGLANQQAFAGFNWLVPINTAKEFIQAAGINTEERSLFDKDWAAALHFFSEGKYDEAESALKNALVYMPDQPDAMRLLLRLKETTANLPAKKGGGSWLVIIAAIGAACLILLIGFLVIAKNKRSGAGTKAKPAARPTTVSPVSRPVGLGVLIGRTLPFKDKTFPISAAGMKIGRDATKNDIAVDHDETSREHLWVGPEDGKIVVKDLGSTNGTFINSVASGPVQRAVINPGDIIIIGKGGFTSLIYKKE